MRGPVSAEILCRLYGNDGDSHCHQPPRAHPESGSPRTGLRPWGAEPDAAPAIRHDSWALRV
jgi:hypothetical protein